MTNYHLKIILKPLIIIILIFSISFLFQSCMIRFKEEVNKKEYFKFALENNIPLDKIRYLDKDDYKALVKNNTLDSQQHVMLQPLQAFYFENNSIVSFNCNCISGGWGNGIFKITWNRTGMYDKFPPDDNDWFKLETKIDIDTIFNYSKPLLNIDDQKERSLFKNKKYTIFIYWGLFLERKSKNLIKQIHKNLEEVNKNDYEIYYIITDKFYGYYISDN